MNADARLGWACIALAICFNVPYLVLVGTFDYPGILREPPGVILAAFAQGGDALVLTWWMFGMCALAQLALACGLLASRGRADGTAVCAAIVGSLAGLTQAIGLWRWSFAVPGIAATWLESGPVQRHALESGFAMLHQFGGVAIGEHLGQWLTVGWVILLTRSESDAARIPRPTVLLAAGSSLGIGVGALEGLTTATDLSIGLLAWGAPVGYLFFTAWLIAIGIGRLNGRSDARARTNQRMVALPR